MYIFQIEDNILQLVYKLESEKSKRLISCVCEYKGKLISVRKSKLDFEIMIETMKFNQHYQNPPIS